jgi:hypothetical protein
MPLPAVRRSRGGVVLLNPLAPECAARLWVSCPSQPPTSYTPKSFNARRAEQNAGLRARGPLGSLKPERAPPWYDEPRAQIGSLTGEDLL